MGINSFHSSNYPVSQTGGQPQVFSNSASIANLYLIEESAKRFAKMVFNREKNHLIQKTLYEIDAHKIALETSTAAGENYEVHMIFKEMSVLYNSFYHQYWQSAESLKKDKLRNQKLQEITGNYYAACQPWLSRLEELNQKGSFPAFKALEEIFTQGLFYYNIDSVRVANYKEALHRAPHHSYSFRKENTHHIPYFYPVDGTEERIDETVFISPAVNQTDERVLEVKEKNEESQSVKPEKEKSITDAALLDDQAFPPLPPPSQPLLNPPQEHSSNSETLAYIEGLRQGEDVTYGGSSRPQINKDFGNKHKKKVEKTAQKVDSKVTKRASHSQASTSTPIAELVSKSNASKKTPFENLQYYLEIENTKEKALGVIETVKDLYNQLNDDYEKSVGAFGIYQLYIVLEQTDEAVHWLTIAKELNHKKAFILLVQHYQSIGQTEKALTIFDQPLLEYDVEALQIYAGLLKENNKLLPLSEVYRLLLVNGQKQYKKVYSSTLFELGKQAGSVNERIQYLRNALEQDPKNKEIQESLKVAELDKIECVLNDLSRQLSSLYESFCMQLSFIILNGESLPNHDEQSISLRKEIQEALKSHKKLIESLSAQPDQCKIKSPVLSDLYLCLALLKPNIEEMRLLICNSANMINEKAILLNELMQLWQYNQITSCDKNIQAFTALAHTQPLDHIALKDHPNWYKTIEKLTFFIKNRVNLWKNTNKTPSGFEISLIKKIFFLIPHLYPLVKDILSEEFKPLNKTLLDFFYEQSSKLRHESFTLNGLLLSQSQRLFLRLNFLTTYQDVLPESEKQNNVELFKRQLEVYIDLADYFHREHENRKYWIREDSKLISKDLEPYCDRKYWLNLIIDLDCGYQIPELHDVFLRYIALMTGKGSREKFNDLKNRLDKAHAYYVGSDRNGDQGHLCLSRYLLYKWHAPIANEDEARPHLLQALEDYAKLDEVAIARIKGYLADEEARFDFDFDLGLASFNAFRDAQKEETKKRHLDMTIALLRGHINHHDEKKQNIIVIILRTLLVDDSKNEDLVRLLLKHAVDSKEQTYIQALYQIFHMIADRDGRDIIDRATKTVQNMMIPFAEIKIAEILRKLANKPK